MKKTIILLVLLFVSAVIKVAAQCNPSIPANAKVIFTSTNNTGFGAPVWVCPGATDSTNQNNRRVFLEVGASYYGKNGIRDTSFVPKGAKIWFDNAAFGQVIYFVDSADVGNTGSNSVKIQCPSITYNYANAPTPGCIMTTNIAQEKTPAGRLAISPNATSGRFTVSFTGKPQDNTSLLFVYDLLGNIVYSSAFTGDTANLNLSEKPRGIYLVRVQSNSEVYTQRLMMQ